MNLIPSLLLPALSARPQDPGSPESVLALEAARAAVERAPEDPDARLELGRSQCRAGLLGEAIDSFGAVIALRPESAGGHRWRGFCHLAAGQPAAALADLGAALERDPESAWTWHARGRARIALRDLPGAERDCTRSLELAPDSVEARSTLGTLLAARGDAGAAAVHLSRALELVAAHSGARAHDRLWLRIARLEGGASTEEQDRLLAEWYDSAPRGDPSWGERLVLFTLGRVGAEQLQAWTADREEPWTRTAPTLAARLCQARFHAAWQAAARGEPKPALYAYLDALESLGSAELEWEASRLRLRELARRHAIPVWSGLQLAPPDPEFARLAGIDPRRSLAIVALDPYSMAARVGLQVGDVVLQVEGQAADRAAFGAALEARLPGDALQLEVMRGARRSRFELVLGVRR